MPVMDMYTALAVYVVAEIRNLEFVGSARCVVIHYYI